MTPARQRESSDYGDMTRWVMQLMAEVERLREALVEETARRLHEEPRALPNGQIRPRP